MYTVSNLIHIFIIKKNTQLIQWFPQLARIRLPVQQIEHEGEEGKKQRKSVVSHIMKNLFSNELAQRFTVAGHKGKLKLNIQPVYKLYVGNVFFALLL